MILVRGRSSVSRLSLMPPGGQHVDWTLAATNGSNFIMKSSKLLCQYKI